MNVSLSAPGPLDVASTLSRYRRWGEDPVNRLEDGRFRRALQHFYNRGRALSEPAIRRRASRWGEHQNMAIHYLLAGQRLAAPSTGGGA
jgi:3-methyladenine DNA glycosylase/8-oxoguanine DNA glycosylase